MEKEYLKTYFKMKLEKGQIIEINISETEKSVKAIVLDVIPTNTIESDFYTTSYYTYILYSGNKLFKMSNECQYGIGESYTEEGEPISGEFEHWSDLQYDGIIVDNCEIKSLAKIK